MNRVLPSAALLAAALLVCPARSQPAGGSSVSVRIASLRPFLDSLPAEERTEQLKDWALLGLLSHLRSGPEQAEETFRGRLPMRYPYVRERSAKTSSPGRLARVGPRDCVAVLPLPQARDATALGRLLDADRPSGRPVPDGVRVFGYELAPDSAAIRMTELRTVPGKELFSEKSGYHEAEIGTLEDLRALLGSVSDITLLRWKGDRLTLGGRAYPWGAAGALSLEDVAALYQAYGGVPSAEDEKRLRAAYEETIRRRYEQAVKRDPRLRRALRQGRLTPAQALRLLRRHIPYPGDREPNVGFSLDPVWDHAAMAGELRDLAGKEGRFKGLGADPALGALVDSTTAEMLAAADHIRSKGDHTPLLRLERRFESPATPAESRLQGILKSIELGHSFQAARYDGDLRGTSPGNILFYTDLLAKLWALDYAGLSPKGAVPGFRRMQDIRVPKTYWEDFLRLSKTRLWFGLRAEGFDVVGDELLFEPVATRVYAASSDPMHPGKESEPNYQSGEFLGWWDAHYAAMAGYEPYYHKLNEIQKWGCILTLLKAKRLRGLDFLKDVRVDRSADFEAWYKAGLSSVSARVPIPFLDRKTCRKDTECLDLLHSLDYPLMGRRYYLSGGVTLASRKDILAKLGRRKPSGGTARRRERAPRTAAAPSSLRGGKGAAPSDRLTLSTSERKADYGSLTAAREQDGVELSWAKGPGAVCHEYLDALARAQDGRRPGYKDESLLQSAPGTGRVVRLARWDAYLIQHRELSKGWIYLRLNEAGKPGGAVATAAGAEPDSDVFSARIVSDAEARKLVETRGGVTIFPG